VPEWQDDQSIGNNERLWRRVHPTQVDFDKETGEPRVSSGVFNTGDGLSVSIASETTIETLLRNYPEHSVVEFEAGVARSVGCIVVRDRTLDDPAHALVWGPKSRGRLNKTQMETLRNAATLKLYRPPPERGSQNLNSDTDRR